MTRILGVDIPGEKRIEASLPYLYGIGPSLAKKIIATCGVDPNKRTKNLTEEDVNKLQKELEKYKIEGDKITREKNCPRCGPGIFLSKSGNRLYCGRCHYVEMKAKK